MRTPTWETSTGALAAMFAEFGPVIFGECWTITLADGTVLRWSGHDTSLTLGSRTFVLGPGIIRSRLKWRVGISTDTMTMTLLDILSTTINGQGLYAFVRGRGLVGARIQLERAFWRPSDTGPVGAILLFDGDYEDSEIDRVECVVRVSSWTKRLNVAVPNGVYQSQCLNSLFDGVCGLSRAAFTVSSAATTPTTLYRTAFGHNLNAGSYPTDWGTLGRITMTSGANAGISRTCKLHTASQLVALQPWPFPVAAGDSFSLEAGCDRDFATCRDKFANINAFRGHPYVPAAETIL